MREKNRRGGEEYGHQNEHTAATKRRKSAKFHNALSLNECAVATKPGDRSHHLFRYALCMSVPGDRELVQILDASFADSARRSGAWLVCHAGCTQCCFGAFAINQLDAQRLRDGMAALRMTDPTLAAEVERRAADYISRLSADFPGDPATGILAEDEDSKMRFDDFANEEPCPALDPATGRCDLYDARPQLAAFSGRRSAPAWRAAWESAIFAFTAPPRKRLLPAKCRSIPTGWKQSYSPRSNRPGFMATPSSLSALKLSPERFVRLIERL